MVLVHHWECWPALKRHPERERGAYSGWGRAFEIQHPSWQGPVWEKWYHLILGAFLETLVLWGIRVLPEGTHWSVSLEITHINTFSPLGKSQYIRVSEKPGHKETCFTWGCLEPSRTFSFAENIVSSFSRKQNGGQVLESWEPHRLWGSMECALEGRLQACTRTRAPPSREAWRCLYGETCCILDTEKKCQCSLLVCKFDTIQLKSKEDFCCYLKWLWGRKQKIC